MSEITLENGVVIDRSRLSHRDSKKSILLQARLTAATASGDIEALTQVIEDVDTHVAKVIVSVPDDFYMPDTPADERCPAPGWMDHLRQDKYEEITQLMREDPVGTEGN